MPSGMADFTRVASPFDGTMSASPIY